MKDYESRKDALGYLLDQLYEVMSDPEYKKDVYKDCDDDFEFGDIGDVVWDFDVVD
ncbi:MAG: hypothetical protein WC175_05615 [Candidatus Dojkabacteria bacterium]